MEKEEFNNIAFNMLKELSPDVDKNKWVRAMVDSYAKTILELYGDYPLGIISAMEYMWDNCYYKDTTSGLKKKYSEWGNFFSTKK